MKTEFGVMLLQAQECQQLLANHQKWRETWNHLSSWLSGGTNSNYTLILDFQAPRLQDNTLLFYRVPSSCYCVIAALANGYKHWATWRLYIQPLDMPAFHASWLCTLLKAILISLCCKNGAITFKLSLNHKHLCFTHGSVPMAGLNAAGLRWTWLQHMGWIWVCSLSSFWDQDWRGLPHTDKAYGCSNHQDSGEVWPHNHFASWRRAHFHYWLFHMAFLCLPATYPNAHPFPAWVWLRCRVTVWLSCPLGFPRDQLWGVEGGGIIWAWNSTKAWIVQPSTWFLWHIYIETMLTNHGHLRMFN